VGVWVSLSLLITRQLFTHTSFPRAPDPSSVEVYFKILKGRSSFQYDFSTFSNFNELISL